MTTVETFLIALLIIFALPYLVWRLAGAPAILPLVVVQIVAGVLLGPGALGAVFPAYHAAVFHSDVILALNGIAWWGVMLFVFLAGLELDLTDAWEQRRDTALTASLALLVPMITGCGAALILVQSPGWVGAQGTDWQAVLGIGIACAVTALPILVLFLKTLNLLRQPLGQRILRYASLDDAAIWAILALILFDWNRLERQGSFAIGFVLASLLIRRIMPRLAENDRWALGLIWLAACSLAADWAGLHYMVGGFLSGVVLEAKWFNRVRIDAAFDTLLSAIMPVFFLSTGLRTSWEMGGFSVISAAGLLLVAAIGGKLIGVRLAGWILGWNSQEAWVIGWFLQTKALIMIIFSSILLDKAIITSAGFTALLLMAIASTMLTMPIVSRRLATIPEPQPASLS